ncbi:ribose-phosphate pyrophosphokinase [Pedobacter changchengzhani]|uniref:Ribose-phosphate pyrophosphokinase n=1 Tax=Pedobacter changchengzhani TaxID=2529274 RepID=A0A4R5MM71_9SPHI|nr:ribose-phosphate diphosphokinase [Pedobacter changchengzhani]TDG36365.1 ribose-phosphate pyrophosphokinase [Pedobacter changchengzhani]
MLNLSKNFSPLGEENLVPFQTFTFAGGEPHIKISNNFDATKPVTITQRINSFNDLGFICLAVDALRRMDVEEIHLFIPYFPAARQDRVMVVGEPLSVKVYADMLNALNFESVTIFDPHSEVAPALLNNCKVVSNNLFIKKVIELIGSDVKLISPDGGALKKIYKVSEFLGGVEVVECSKSRNVKTGKLSGFKVYADDLNGADCLIVDDICDGGGTFIGLAEELKNKNAGKLYLAISHGIFSKGFNELGKCFERIFTTDSIREIEEEKVTQIKLSDVL